MYCGSKHSDESKLKISEASKKMWADSQFKEKMKIIRKQQAIKMKKNPNYWEERKQTGKKISKILTGKKLTEAHCRKLSEAHKGRKKTEAQITKLKRWHRDRAEIIYTCKICNKKLKGVARWRGHQVKHSNFTPWNKNIKMLDRTKIIFKSCRNCEKRIRVLPCQEEHKKFCNRDCYVEYCYKNRTKKDRIRISGWGRIRKGILEKQKVCNLCWKEVTPKNSFKFAVHHCDGNKFNLDEHNLLLFCNSCHSFIHADKKNREFWDALTLVTDNLEQVVKNA